MAYTYGEGVYGAGLYSAIDTPFNTEIRTFSFSIDGHPFVLIKLGTQGHLVYDHRTRQWSSWTLDDQIGLRVKDGESFAEFYLMGDPETNQIHTFDMFEQEDEDGEFTTIVRGGVSLRRRDSDPCFVVYAAGRRSPDDGKEITLLTSDDGGYNWQNHGTIEINDDDEAVWRSIGLMRYPGRIFQIEDTGVFSSIEGLDTDG